MTPVPRLRLVRPLLTTVCAALVALVALFAAPSARAAGPDQTPPVTVANGGDARWHRTAVNVVLSATDDASGVAATYLSLDGAPFEARDEVTVEAPADHSGDGVHTIAFYSVDADGNRETEQRAIVRIDTRAPRFRWKAVVPAVLFNQRPVSLSFTVGEPSGAVSVSLSITDQYGRLVRRIAGLSRDAGDALIAVKPAYRGGGPFVPGLYRVCLRLADEAGNVTATGNRSFRDYRPVTASVWHGVPGAGRRVALTFDDSGAAAWRAILDTLKGYRVHASFFPLADAVTGSPGLARRTVAEGHGIGSHGWSHGLMSSMDPSQVRTELARSESAWWSAAKVTPVPYCRPPYGGYTSASLGATGSMGFARTVLWDVDPQDWAGAGPATIASRVLSHLHDGAIVCLHLRGETAAALPAILRGMRARGYRAVSLPELFRAAGYR